MMCKTTVWILMTVTLISGCNMRKDECAELGLKWASGLGGSCYDPATLCSLDDSSHYPRCESKRPTKEPGR